MRGREMAYKIVETDNFCGDYPDEKFVNLPRIANKDNAECICRTINEVLCWHDGAPRYWKVVDEHYELHPGFEP